MDRIAGFINRAHKETQVHPTERIPRDGNFFEMLKAEVLQDRKKT